MQRKKYQPTHISNKKGNDLYVGMHAYKRIKEPYKYLEISNV